LEQYVFRVKELLRAGETAWNRKGYLKKKELMAEEVKSQ